MGLTDLSVTFALVFSERKSILHPLKVELKKIGFNADHVDAPRTVKDFIARCRLIESALIILDWDSGADKVLRILSENRTEFRAESHPVLLLSAKVDERVVAVAAEHNCTNVHVGDVSQANLKDLLKKLFEETRNLSPVKQLILKVEQSRANGELAIAANLLNQLAVKVPGNRRISCDLADCYMALGEIDRARQILEIVAKGDPPYARAQHLLARCYLRKGETEKALQAYKDAQNASPFSVERLSEMGHLYLNTNRPEQAKAMFNELLSLAPESKTAKAGKGTSMMLLGEVNEALTMMRETSTPQELASVFNTAAILSIRSNKHDEGMGLYKTALQALDGKQKLLARIMFNMGIGYVKWDKIDQSMRCFSKACDLDPTFEAAKHNLNVVNQKVRKKDSAAIAASNVIPLKKKDKEELPIEAEMQSLPKAAGADLLDLTHLAEGINSGNSGGSVADFSSDGELDFSVDFDEQIDDVM